MTSSKDLLIRLGTGIPAVLIGVYFRDFFHTSAGMQTFIFGASVAIFAGLWIAGRKIEGGVWFAFACGIATCITMYAIFFSGSAYAGFAVLAALACLGHYTGFFKRYGFVLSTARDDKKEDDSSQT